MHIVWPSDQNGPKVLLIGAAAIVPIPQGGGSYVRDEYSTVRSFFDGDKVTLVYNGQTDLERMTSSVRNAVYDLWRDLHHAGIVDTVSPSFAVIA